VTAQREIFVSVDIETAGPIPGEYSPHSSWVGMSVVAIFETDGDLI
jgi:hypothetical protein